MKTLFAPLGFSYGSLFSAIALTKPDHVIVVSSEIAGENLPKVISALDGIHNCDSEIHIISDPFIGFLEGRQLAKQLAKKATDQNIACLTGSTTALQDTIKTIAILTDADEIAVIDRRPIEDQRSDPFVVGELVQIPKLDPEIEK